MGNKYLADNESLKGVMLKDKSFILTKTKGLDYKASYNVLLLQLEKDIVYKQFLRDVAEEFKVLAHNQNRDELKIKDDMFEYVLCNGQEGSKSEYPEYCNKIGITSDTFNFPDFKDGTIAMNPVGSGQSNGLYKLDSIKSHNHGMPNITGNFHTVNKAPNLPENAFYLEYRWSTHLAGTKNGDDWGSVISFSSHRAGATHTHITGDERTQMRHTTVQIYVKAKFLE